MTNVLEQTLCVADPWLTQVLGCAVYRLDTSSPWFVHALQNVVLCPDCLQQSPVFAYAKLFRTDSTAAERLSALGFYCVEATLIFEKKIPTSPPNRQGTCAIRFATADDEPEVRRIARTSFVYSRFHRDHRFSKDKADAVKEAWAANFFRGRRGTHLVVAESEVGLAGFLLLCAEDTTLTIDLFAVDPEYRCQGIARTMLGFAEHVFPGISHIKVGTQAANIPSIRLYQRCGFLCTDSGYVFHYHH